MRSFWIFLSLALIVSQALADLPPSPPPPGKKYVSVSNTVVLDPKVEGYVFILQDGQGPGPPQYTYKRLSLSEKPTSISCGGRYRYVSIVAISQEDSRKYTTEEELSEAYRNNKIKNVGSLGFGDQMELSSRYPRDSVNLKTIITGVDSKKGFLLQRELDGKPYDPSAPSADVPDEKDKPSRTGGRSAMNSIIAGLCISGAVVSLGLWAARRSRSRRPG